MDTFIVDRRVVGMKEVIVRVTNEDRTKVRNLTEHEQAFVRVLLNRFENCHPMELAGSLYIAYCKEVGNVAYDGKPLPVWTEFSACPASKKQTLGWLAVAEAVLGPGGATPPRSEEQWAEEALKEALAVATDIGVRVRDWEQPL